MVGDRRVDAGADLDLRADDEAPAREQREGFALALEPVGLSFGQGVAAELEAPQPLVVDVVDLSETARGVAWVLEGAQLAFDASPFSFSKAARGGTISAHARDLRGSSVASVSGIEGT